MLDRVRGVSWIEQIGRYRVERLLGSGAFASVWLAHDDLLDVPVAVKVLADNWSVRLDVRGRFITEAKLLRQADSDRVLRVLDIGELPDGRPYFVTSYADGGSLADRLAEGELPPDEALNVLVQVCESVCVLHEMGVVHRDLKPSNVLFKTDNAGRRRLLLADLGIAKALAQGSGLTVMAGSPGYMAPEQAAHAGIVDERTDVYGLGAMGYRLLAGRTVNQEPPATLPGRAGQAIRRALDPDPDRRWPSARAMAVELSQSAQADRLTVATTAARAQHTQLMPAVGGWQASSSVLTSPPTERFQVLPPQVEEVQQPDEPASARHVPLGWIALTVALLAAIAGLGIFFGQGGNLSGQPAEVSPGAASRAAATLNSVGPSPTDVAVSPAGDLVLVPSGPARSVTVIPTNGTEGYSIAVDRYVSDIDLTHDGRTAYLTSPSTNEVVVLDISAATVTKTIKVGGSPSDIAVGSDDRAVWVTNRESGTVSVIDTERKAVTATIKVGQQPTALAITPDGRHAYVANRSDDSLSVIDTATRAVIDNYPTFSGGSVDVLISPDGHSAYLANLNAGTVSVLDIDSKLVRRTVMLHGEPTRLAAAGGNQVYVTDAETNVVTMISADGIALDSWQVEKRPTGIAVSPDGRKAYVVNTDSGSMSVLDLPGG